MHIDVTGLNLPVRADHEWWTQQWAVVVSARLPDGSVVPVLNRRNILSCVLDLTEEHSNWTPGFGFREAVGVVRSQVQAMVDFFSSIVFPVRVYRGVRVPLFVDLTDADVVARAGRHWTPCVEVARAFAEGRHQQARWRHEAARPVLLSGRILEPKDVDWKASGSKYLVWSAPRMGGQAREDFEREDELQSTQVVGVHVMPPTPDLARPIGSMSAPGYRSWSWTQQDWRSVEVGAGGALRWDRACGAKGTRGADGRPALCLPLAVIEELAASAVGLQILREQAKRKAAAAPGARVPWHPEIKRLHAELEAITPKDKPKRRKR